MDKQKFYAIIERLNELSEKSQLKWQTTGNTNKFLLALKDSSISIGGTFFADTGLINVEFRNEKGEVVEKVEILSTEDKESFKRIKILYELARRKALNSDETIDRILEQLDPKLVTA